MTMFAPQATSPAAGHSPGAGASEFFQESETCACLNEVCSATIPRSHVVNRIDPRNGRQEVKAICPYCRTKYGATRVLSDGRWKTIAFHMEPAEGFEPIGGTPRPVFPTGFPGAAPIAPRPSPMDAPAVARLDTDCDAAAAAAVKERTLDTGTSQLPADFHDTDWDGMS